MYSCNDCGEKFETPENDACPHCGSGDYFEETLEDVVNEADEKNKERIACSLKEFGEKYIRYKNTQEAAKNSVKGIIEMAEEQGITKDMLIAYANAIQLADFNKKVLCSAVQQDLELAEPVKLDEEKTDAEDTANE